MHPALARFLFASMLLLPASAHAQQSTPIPPQSTPAPQNPAPQGHGPKIGTDSGKPLPEVNHVHVWNYLAGANDDEGWGELSPDYATCDLGHNQSPIQISDTTISAMQALNYHYHKAPMTIEKKDRTLVITMKGAGYMIDEGHRWNLQEMRIHTPAEHEIAGSINPVELHLIHTDDQGKILIVAIFMDYSRTPNPALQEILDKMPHRTKIVAPASFDPSQLLPEQKGHYAYSGSLSWPPCTEDVEWRVLKGASKLTHEQMEMIGRALGRNARLLQPKYWRVIKETMN